MSWVVWKSVIKIIRDGDVTLPKGARILTAQMQGSSLCLWSLVNSAMPEELRTIRVYGTGHPIAPPDTLADDPLSTLRYIATVQDRGGLVWHVFEVLT